MRWRLIVDGPASGACNMAVDEALLEGVQAKGRPVLRLYRWQPACLSLGRNQAATHQFDAALAAARAIDIVRRPTGGLAVYHDRELTYAVVLPVGLLGRPRATYVAINRALARGLQHLEVAAQSMAVASPRGTPDSLARRGQSGSHPCFQEAAQGEVMVGGRKLVGSAQRTEDHAILQHGSILVGGDQSEVLELGHRDLMETPSCTALETLLGRTPDWAELEASIIAGFEEEFRITFERDKLTDLERLRARAIEVRYRSTEWTWLR